MVSMLQFYYKLLLQTHEKFVLPHVEAWSQNSQLRYAIIVSTYTSHTAWCEPPVSYAVCEVYVRICYSVPQLAIL